MKYTVRVHAGSKVEKIEVFSEKVEIWTRARAHDGEANEAVVRAMAEKFGVAKGRVEIVRGATSRDKIVEIK